MKHFLHLWLLIFGLSVHHSQAQSLDSAAQKLASIFANVDKSQVPTGYLYEAGLRFLEPRTYRGVLTDSSLTDQSVLRYLRLQMASSRVTGTDTLPQVRAYNTRMAAALASAGGVIPLTMQCMLYATIRPDALQQNLLREQNKQLFDVVGRSQSPYQTNTLFAAAPIFPFSRTGTVSFVFRRNLYLTNIQFPLPSLYLDFGDGNGYRSASWDQTISTTYSSAGTKRIKVKLIFPSKFNIPADTRESWFDFDVLTAGAVARTANSAAADLEVPFNSTNAHSGGRAYIIYGNSPGGTKHTQLTKPFIISEGYNLYDIAPELRKCNNPNNDVDAFFRSIGTAYTGSFDFATKLLNTGYDIVYIDNARGTDDITRNAQLFEDVVRWVNTNKVGGRANGEKNVVMGQSMGGLVSRYGLADMTKRPGDDPHTRLLILHDSPQRGANNPVGLQSLSRATDSPIIGFPGLFEFSLADLVPKLTAAIRVLNQPASQQLSIYNAFDGRGDIRANTFINGTYHQMVDYNAPYPVVAVSDGSQCGQTQGISPHTTLSESNLNFFLRPLPVIGNFGISGTLSAYSLPDYFKRDIVSRARFYLDYNLCIGVGLFSFCVPIHFNLINQAANSPANALPLENLPGGNSNPKTEAGECADPINFGAIPGLYAAYLFTNLYNGPICFVPTYSSNDVPSITPTTAYSHYINSTTDNPVAPNVQFYLGQETVSSTQFNQAHIRFTPRNSEWLFDQMQNDQKAASDIACMSVECTALTPISGPTQICESPSSVFTVNSSQATWTASPSYLFTTATGSGSQFTTAAAAGQQGTGTITAKLACGNSVTKNVSVGPAEPSGYYNGPNASGQRLGTVQFVAAGQYSIFLDQPYTFTFTSSSSSVTLSSQSGRSTSFYLPASSGVTIRATSSGGGCGYAGQFVFSSNRGYGYAATPNPSSSELTVVASDEDASSPQTTGELKSKSKKADFVADLYDANGMKVKTKRSDQGKAVLDIRELPNGLYNLRVGQGKDAYTEHIQIVH